MDSPGLFASELKVMKDTAVRMVRVPFYWSQAQPYRSMSAVPPAQRTRFKDVGGRPTTFAPTDWIIGSAAKADMPVLPIVLETPSWAALHPRLGNSPPAGSANYGAFLQALIGRYGPHGSYWSEHPDLPKRPLRAWQIWNEPNHFHYWSDQPFARGYVRLAAGARRAIKRADPGAQVIGAGFADRSWVYLASVYKAGGKGVFDVIAIHPYTYEPRNVLRIVEYARAAMVKAGDGKRPMWLTEVTWSSGRRPGHRPYPFETTKQDMAARLSRALPLLIQNSRRLRVSASSGRTGCRPTATTRTRSTSPGCGC